MSERSSAVISGDDKYRYRLDRWWGPGPRLVWVMLNPSTADASKDDPTIRRVRRFTEREGFDGFTVVNLFAYRATDPRALRSITFAEAVGPDNEKHLTELLGNRYRCEPGDAPMVVAAWGSPPFPSGGVWIAQTAYVADGAAPTRCLGVTAHGHPRHPLYVKADQPFAAWKP